VIHGKLQSEDRKKLETLVGRVPYLSGKVKSVVTSWPEFVVAAKVERDNTRAEFHRLADVPPGR
jgi:hypothetical protein